MDTKNTPPKQPSYLAQIRQLRTLAKEAVKQYSLTARHMEFIKYGTNGIFRITDSQQKQYALRIPDSHHEPSAILEEIGWMNHILETTDVTVPKPIKTLSGQYIVEASHPTVSSSRCCLLFEWLPGKKKWKSINENYANHLGEIIAKLHRSGLHFPMNHRNYWLADGLIGVETAKLYNIEKLPTISAQEQQQLTSARRMVYTILKDQEQKYPNKTGVIHSDTQPNNILVHEGRFSMIDFDDCGIGFYNDDLAVALCAFEHIAEGNPSKSFPLLKEALLNGYSKHMPLSEEDLRLLPYFMLTRKLVTIAWIEAHNINPRAHHYFPIAIARAIQFYEKIRSSTC